MSLRNKLEEGLLLEHAKRHRRKPRAIVKVAHRSKAVRAQETADIAAYLARRPEPYGG